MRRRLRAVLADGRQGDIRLTTSLSQRGNAERSERLDLVRRGQNLGFGALVLILATIVMLAAIGQPWVAGIVATTGLVAIVTVFVTGECRPSPARSSEHEWRQPSGLAQEESADGDPSSDTGCGAG